MHTEEKCQECQFKQTFLSENHLVFLVAISLSSKLVLLLRKAELLISFYEGVRIWLLAVFSVSRDGRKMAVSPLGISLDQFL